MRQRVLVLLLLLTVGGAVVTSLSPEPPAAEASTSGELKKASSSELVTYIQSGAALNLRLMALEALRKKKGTSVNADLVKVAKGGDLEIAVFATTALGKRKTSGAKAELKKLVEGSKLKKEVRKGAMTAIAVHWNQLSDLDYLWSKAKGDTALKAHHLWLKKKIYKQ